MSRSTTRKQAQAEETRRLILDAALRLFAEHGYAATSVAAIAEEAGVAVPTVYASVGAKPVLMRRLLDRIDEMAGIPELARQGREARTPEDVLGFALRLTRQLAENCGDVIAAMNSAATADPELAELVVMGDRRHTEGARGVAKRLHAADALRPGVDTEHAAALIDALTQPEVFGRLVHTHDWSYDTAEEVLGRVLATELLGESQRPV